MVTLALISSPVHTTAPAAAPAPSKKAATEVAANAFAELHKGQSFANAAPSVSAAASVQIPALVKHLDAAKETVRYVLEKIPESPNYLDRPELKPTGQLKNTIDAHGMANTKYEMAFSYLADPKYLDEPAETAMPRLASTAEKHGTGTCFEMSVAGYLQIHKNHPELRVELFGIDGAEGNHIFLVIGRDPKSKPEDYKNWGANAVVCDPWGAKFYPATQIEKELRSFKEQKFEADGTVRTVFAPFEPGKQTLVRLPGLD